MSIYTYNVVSAANDLEKAEAAHQACVNRLNQIRGHKGQSGYAITIDGVRVDVSVCDSRTYQGTLIRGREMIHLGALKVLGAEVDFAKLRVQAAKEKPELIVKEFKA